jgi:hypothetical protein
VRHVVEQRLRWTAGGHCTGGAGFTPKCEYTNANRKAQEDLSNGESPLRRTSHGEPDRFVNIDSSGVFRQPKYFRLSNLNRTPNNPHNVPICALGRVIITVVRF